MTSSNGAIRLAVIDSDSGFVQVLGNRLERAGWRFRALPAPPPAEELVAMRVNAIVVDLSLLGSQAWDFLESTVREVPGIGIVVVTERSTVAQRVRGLRLGADDWIAKPCHPEEVIARVEAVVRRRKHALPPIDTGPVVAGELEIRADQFQAYARGASADLTRREFELLQLLSDVHGQVMQRDEIYQRVWGYAMAHGDRSVDVFVRKLRQKIEAVSPDWTYIHTHFGIGYRFEPEPKEGTAQATSAPATATPAATASAASKPDRNAALATSV